MSRLRVGIRVRHGFWNGFSAAKIFTYFSITLYFVKRCRKRANLSANTTTTQLKVTMQSVQSRLKSRKLLGVGEGADGQQPRSKITQILGSDSVTNSQLSSYDYSIVFTILQYSTCLYFSGIGLVSLLCTEAFLPEDMKVVDSAQSQQLDYVKRIHSYAITAIRSYGAAMLALASLTCMVTLFNWQSRRAVRVTLLATAAYFLCDCLVSLQWLGTSDEAGWRIEHGFLSMKIVFFVLSTYFYRQIEPTATYR